MSLGEKLDAIREGAKARIPAEALAVMHGVTVDLIASGAASRALEEGEPAPEFALLDSQGQQIQSRSLLKRGPMVATFYRGLW